MYKRVQYLVSLLVLLSFVYFMKVLFPVIFVDESVQVDEWLEQNELGDYKKMYRDYGISTLSGCGTPDHLDRLPELPAAEEKRLRRAAHVLQQRLVLRQWLATHRLQHAYTKLLSLDVSSLEDVYWLEDSTARHVLDPKDFNAWSAARQSLPTGKDALVTLKADLWNTVVKNSKHQDAWTWGGMLVVSVSVCGLVTLAAMTQPSLAPEAKHSLLQYVTGKYLHPGSCRVSTTLRKVAQVAAKYGTRVSLRCSTGGVGVGGAARGRRDHVLHRGVLPEERPAVPGVRHRRAVRRHHARHPHGGDGGGAGLGRPGAGAHGARAFHRAHRRALPRVRHHQRRGRGGQPVPALVRGGARGGGALPRGRGGRGAGVRGGRRAAGGAAGARHVRQPGAARGRRVRGGAAAAGRAGAGRGAGGGGGVRGGRRQPARVAGAALPGAGRVPRARVVRGRGAAGGRVRVRGAVGGGAGARAARRRLQAPGAVLRRAAAGARQAAPRAVLPHAAPAHHQGLHPQVHPEAHHLVPPVPLHQAGAGADGGGLGAGGRVRDRGRHPAGAAPARARARPARRLLHAPAARQLRRGGLLQEQAGVLLQRDAAAARAAPARQAGAARAALRAGRLQPQGHQALLRRRLVQELRRQFPGGTRRGLGRSAPRVVHPAVRRAVRRPVRAVRLVQRLAQRTRPPQPRTPPSTASQVEALRVRGQAGGQVPVRVGAGRALPPAAARPPHARLPRADHRAPRHVQALRAGRPGAVPVQDQVRAGDGPGRGRQRVRAVLRRRRVRPQRAARRDARPHPQRRQHPRAQRQQAAVPGGAGAVAAVRAVGGGDGGLPARPGAARARHAAGHVRRERAGAAGVRHGRAVPGRLAALGGRGGRGRGLGAPAGLVLGGAGRLHAAGARAPAAVRHGQLAAPAGRLPRAVAALPAAGGRRARRPPLGPHVLQPAGGPALRLVRAAGARAAHRHQRGRRRLRHDMNDKRSEAGNVYMYVHNQLYL